MLVFSKSIQKKIGDIASLKIQGASQVQRQGIAIIREWALQSRATDSKALQKEFIGLSKKLVFSRPTEPGLRTAVRIAWHAMQSADSLAEQKNAVLLSCNLFEKNRQGALKQIAVAAEKLIPNHAKILTHCHSHTVEAVLVGAKEKIEMVYSTETRPLFQGRITAQNLSRHGVAVTQIVDSAAGQLLADKKIDCFFSGADAVLFDGSVINKIGTFPISLAASENKVLHVVATSLFSFDPLTAFGWPEPIEYREWKEVWPDKPPKVKVLNPAFDQTPHRLVKKIVCEKGVLSPSDFVRAAEKKMDWKNSRENYRDFFRRLGFLKKTK